MRCCVCLCLHLLLHLCLHLRPRLHLHLHLHLHLPLHLCLHTHLRADTPHPCHAAQQRPRCLQAGPPPAVHLDEQRPVERSAAAQRCQPPPSVTTAVGILASWQNSLSLSFSLSFFSLVPVSSCKPLSKCCGGRLSNNMVMHKIRLETGNHILLTGGLDFHAVKL